MADDIARFEAAIERFTDAVNNSAPAPIPASSSNSAMITLNAGGFGVWLAVSACAVMLAINMVLIVILVNHDRKIDDLAHYVQAIYMMAPHLKPQGE